jgi:hypothetical protein
MDWRLLTLGGLFFITSSIGQGVIFYADVNGTNPVPPFANWSTAATNIQDAIDAAAVGDEVLVNDGVYAIGSRSLDGSTTNRIAVTNAITVQSLNGPANTIIDGGGSVRCAYLADGAALLGFTLTNGFSPGGGGGVFCSSTNAMLVNCTLVNNTAVTNGGGVVSGNLLNCTLFGNSVTSYYGSGGGLSGSLAGNCVITDNSANFAGGGAIASTLNGCALKNNDTGGGLGGGAANCSLNACTLTGNWAGGEGGGAGSSTLSNCALSGNESDVGGGAIGSTLINCTLGNNFAVFYGGGAESCMLDDCIVYYNSVYYGGSDPGFSSDSILNYSCVQTPTTNGIGNITDAPMFVNQAGGDFHLQSNSPCINMGANSYVNSATDLDGNPRIVQGTVDMGAYEYQLPVPALVLVQSDFANTLPGVPLNFTGSIFRDSSYSSYWDFGDGTVVSNQLAVSHAWGSAGDFPVTLWATDGSNMVSATLLVHVAATQIQPAGQTVTTGDDANFMIVSELPQVAWQWAFDGTNLPGATNDVLTLLNVQTNQAGYYSAVVTLNLPDGYPPGEYSVAVSNTLLSVNPETTNLILYVDENSTNAAWPYADWSTAAPTIQEAEYAAQPGALILVKSGDYLTGAHTIDGITTNRLTVTKAVTIQSTNGPANTAIDGGGVDRCVYLADGARLIGFTLTNGYSSANGGGAFCQTTNSILSNCVIIGCSAVNGGGLYGGTMVNSVISSCGDYGVTRGGGASGSTLINCLSKDNVGYSGGGAAFSTLTGCEVVNNTTLLYAGGLDNCTAVYCNISGNSVQTEGGYGYGGGANAGALTNCIVSGNIVAPSVYAPQAEGGGLSTGTATACIVHGNTSDGVGGGGWGEILYNCIVTGNVAGVSGGGTYQCGVVGSFLSGNWAINDAGGDFKSGMVDCTVVNNESIYGGGGGVDGSSMYNCILYSNSIVEGELPSNGINASYNYCCTTPMPSAGGGNITSPPAFQADGLHLTANSSCRAAGSLAYALGVDIDGLPWLNPPSIGCAEYYTNPVPSLVLQADYTNVLVGFPLNFQAAVIGGQAAYLLWNFGDSSADESGLAGSHAWTAPGDYTVLVTAFFSGTPLTASQSVVIHVGTNDSPAILTQPADQTVTEGGAAQFNVVASGSPVLTYQWQFNGVSIPGATNASLQLDYIQTNQAGVYSVEVMNPLYYPPGEITSSNAGLTVNAPVCLNPPPGMTAWWRAEGDVTDVVDGNNGINQDVTFTNGKVGQALVFTDGSSSITVPASPTLNIGNDSGMTIECWIQPDAFALGGSGAPIVEWDTGTTNFVQFWAGGTLLASIVDQLGVAHVLQSGPGLLDTNHWQHVAFTYDVGSGTAVIYVNGNGVATNNLGGVLPQTTGAVNIGWSPSTTNFFGGLMDELSIYDRALSPTEISAIFNAEYAGKCNVPVAPTVVGQPESFSVLPGAGGEFDVVAAGTAPLTYQWFLDGNPINEATSASLILTNALCSQNGGAYSVEVSNAGGSLASSNAVLTIINLPPQLSSISNQVVSYSAPFATIPFLVSDTGLSASVVAIGGTSSNTNLVPNDQIVFGGSDTNRTVTVTANSNDFGVTTISVTATGPCGAVNQTNFNLIVTNFPPRISSIANQELPINATLGPLAFTVSDVETPANQLVVTASSSNNGIVPTNQIVLGGSGTNRTITFTPGTNAPGTAFVTLTVTDGLGASASASFQVKLDQFTQILPGLPFLVDSAVAWGDYDNDGHLDLLISGSTNGLASGALTRIYHNDNGAFTNFISLTNVYQSAVAWGDYDRDGRLDAIVSGLNSAGVAVTQLYHNNGDGTFTPVNAGFAGAYNGSLAWGDFDNDGAPDLFLSGLVPLGNGPPTNIGKLYRNNGDGTFTDMNANLPGPNGGTAAWADFDNDGRQDLLLAGSINSPFAGIYRNLGNGIFSNVVNFATISNSGGKAAWGDYDDDGRLDVAIANDLASVLVYHNNGDGTFAQTANLSGFLAPFVAWADYNNDGYPDLVLQGSRGTGLYRNNGNGTFTSSGISLPGTANGSLACGDFNNDGNLDIVFVGATPTIYLNDNLVTNTPPTAPADLIATTGQTNSVFFTWAPALDLQTPSSGLNYNLRVGTTPGGIDVVSPMADPTNGQRRIPALGNVGPTNRAMLINLPQGTYYWSAQAIDPAFAGSPFAADGVFSITNPRPAISSIPNQNIAPSMPSVPIPFTLTDAGTSVSNLVLAATSSNPNVVAPTNIVFGGSGSGRTVQITPGTNGVVTIAITATDPQGAFGIAYFVVNAAQFSPAAANFIPVQNGFIVWGDYNNDGWRDVLIAGNTNGQSQSRPVTLLYQNNGNGRFTPVATGFPGLNFGSAAWGDFNNDGYLDLAITGSTNGSPSSTACISRIYRNNGDGTFTDIKAGLPGVYSGSVAWGDFDNDGRLDLLLAGSINGGSSGAITRIYHNNGDGTFSNRVSLTGVYAGSVACADLSGDGHLDIVIAGLNQSGVAVTLVYRNNGDGTFAQVASLPGVYRSSVAIGDFDNDGLPDLLIAGFNGVYQTSVYHNNGGFNFSNIGANLPGAGYGSVAWGDFDNDGRLDILLCGTGNGNVFGAFTRVYHNTGSTNLSQSFTLYPAALPTNYLGTATWADCENSGKLDVLIAGTDGTLIGGYPRSQTLLFRNNDAVSNTPPTAPAALSTTCVNGVVTLNWSKSTDSQTTNSNGLTYQIRAGTSPGGIQIESPASDLITGQRRIVQTGEASQNFWSLANLPPGTYYWSVQAIDSGFAGSPFAPESTFVILPSPVANADVISTSINTPISFNPAALALNDFDPNDLPLNVIALGPKSAQNGSITTSSGIVTYTPPTNFLGNDTFTYMVSDGQSTPAIGAVLVTVGGAWLSLEVVSGPAIVNGNFVMWMTGLPGLTYTIEGAPTPNGPWTKIENVTASTIDQGMGIGAFEILEPVAGNSMGFYRLVYPAY